MTFEDAINAIAGSGISFRDEVVATIRDRVDRAENPEKYQEMKPGDGVQATKDYVKRHYPKPGTKLDPNRPYLVER